MLCGTLRSKNINNTDLYGYKRYYFYRICKKGLFRSILHDGCKRYTKFVPNIKNMVHCNDLRFKKMDNPPSRFNIEHFNF